MQKQLLPTLYMAPLQGVTTAIYRNTYATFFSGYDCAIAPFTRGMESNNPNERTVRDILTNRNHLPFKLIPQILSKSSEEIITLANRMYAMGYSVINWNLGCPLQKIRKKQRGSGLLPYADFIIQILEEVLPSIKNQLSIKVRLGSDSNQDLLRLLPQLDIFPLQSIVIHPRTGQQMYSGQPDLTTFGQCLERTRHSIIYNGDIKTVQDFAQLRNRFPTVQGWMLGRGGVTHPFLPELIKQIRICSKTENVLRFWSFHEELFNAYESELSGPAHLLDKIKEIWYYWSQAFTNSNHVYKSVTRTRTVTQYKSAIKTIKSQPELLRW
jgi:tRNA-dihydrouridine synthase B